MLMAGPWIGPLVDPGCSWSRLGTAAPFRRPLILEVEDSLMTMYFFDVTLRVVENGEPFDLVLYKAARAQDELSARRAILNRYLKGGFQVRRLERVAERSRGRGSNA